MGLDEDGGAFLLRQTVEVAGPCGPFSGLDDDGDADKFETFSTVHGENLDFSPVRSVGGVVDKNGGNLQVVEIVGQMLGIVLGGGEDGIVSPLTVGTVKVLPALEGGDNESGDGFWRGDAGFFRGFAEDGGEATAGVRGGVVEFGDGDTLKDGFGAPPDALGATVVHAEGLGAADNIDSALGQLDGAPEYALVGVADKEEGVGTRIRIGVAGERGKKAKGRRGEVLGFIDDGGDVRGRGPVPEEPNGPVDRFVFTEAGRS